MMLPVIRQGGFSVAFVDVDVYEVTRELLFQLWSVANGNEIVIVDDIDSMGIRAAVNSFHTLSRNVVKERILDEGRVAKLELPPVVARN